MRVLYPKMCNRPILPSFESFTASKGSNFYILFAITAADVLPCGGPKITCISSTGRLNHFFRSFENSKSNQSFTKEIRSTDSLYHDNQADVIEAFNSTSRYIDELLNIDGLILKVRSIKFIHLNCN